MTKMRDPGFDNRVLLKVHPLPSRRRGLGARMLAAIVVYAPRVVLKILRLLAKKVDAEKLDTNSGQGFTGAGRVSQSVAGIPPDDEQH